jgi:hypothetical protein
MKMVCTPCRHCEEHSDAAIYFRNAQALDGFAALAMTTRTGRHCEERSDAAIHAYTVKTLSGFAPLAMTGCSGEGGL